MFSSFLVIVCLSKSL